MTAAVAGMDAGGKCGIGRLGSCEIDMVYGADIVDGSSGEEGSVESVE